MLTCALGSFGSNFHLRMSTYSTAWNLLPPPLRQVLREDGVLDNSSEAQIFVEFLADQKTDWIERAMLLLPLSLQHDPATAEHFESCLLGLKRRAMQSKRPSTILDHWMARQEVLDKRLPIVAAVSAPILDMALKRWKHWKPRYMCSDSHLTQRQVELILADKWLNRLLGHFIKHAASVPHMRARILTPKEVEERLAQQASMKKTPPTSGSSSQVTAASGAENAGSSLQSHKGIKHASPEQNLQLQEWQQLFGTARYTTLRNHCLALETVLRVEPFFIPWSEDTLRRLLDYFLDCEATPAQVQKSWKMLKYLSHRLGLLDPTSIERLTQKKDAIRNQLVTSHIAVSHRALTPSLADIIALEKATVAPGPAADQYAASIFRLQAGTSARYNDISHTQPATMVNTDSTIEFTAWQTKVTGVLDSHRPMPLIAPKHSFSGIAWWLVLERHISGMLADPNMRHIDYLLPTPTKDRSGLLPRACSNAQALRWLRLLLSTHGSTFDTTARITLPSLRVWMADLAYQMQIPRDQRRYIGRWASETTADTYTREHRKVICDIWTHVAQNLSATTNLHSHREVPENISSPHYKLDDEPDAQLPVSLLTPETPPEDLSQEEAAACGADSSDKQLPVALDDPFAAYVTHPRQRRLLQAQHERQQCDLVPFDQGGPLTVVRNVKHAQKDRVYKLHLLTTRGKAYGCGWQPRQVQYEILDEQDYHNKSLHWSECALCFRTCTFPSSWQDREEQPPHTSGS